MIGLAEKHNAARLEAACARAIDAGDPSYKTIRGILAAGTETQLLAAPAAGKRAWARSRAARARSSATCSPSPPRPPAPSRTRPPWRPAR